MEILFEQVLNYCFYAIAFVIPLILSPITSEVFEFNKIVTLYILTTTVVCFWIGKMLLNRKLIFHRTILDIPLLVFLFSQLISTFLSIDFRTSLLGYYSRFNGGFMSTLCYVLLYWTFVSNFDKRKTLNFIYALLSSAVLVSFYGALEHFGIDKALWVQDVQTRVFSTLGQPNWLAAWLVALVPICFGILLNSKTKTFKYWFLFFISQLFFLVLTYTKSRSGIIAFAISDGLFWIIALLLVRIKNTGSLKSVLTTFLLTHALFLIVGLITDSPWRSTVLKPLNKSADDQISQTQGPALEVGGTESGEIRKIVWQGGVDIWKAYPVFGSGVETFAFSYYKFRPVAHNLVSEWDYLYNKAHNEYLNLAATSGTFGLLSYLAIIFFSLYQIYIQIKESSDSPEIVFIQIGLLTGFVSILITNFVGFSVVPTSLELFLFPAAAITFLQSNKFIESQKNKNSEAKLILLFILVPLFGFIYLISRYWLADVVYAKAKSEIRIKDYLTARKNLLQSIKLSPSEAIYLNELGQVDGNLSLFLYDNKSFDEAKKLSAVVEQEVSAAESLSPRNVNIKRDKSAIYTKMSIIDTDFLLKANQTLITLSDLAPTEPKIKLNLAISYLKLGQKDKAKDLLNETIVLKPNYKEARYALATILNDQKNKKAALDELNYILTKIDPKDEVSKNLKAEIEKGN